jgi:hypothetical protein
LGPGRRSRDGICIAELGALQLPVVVEERLLLARLAVGVAVPLIEAPGIGVVPADVDLELFGAALLCDGLDAGQQGGPDALSARSRRDVELVE